MINSHSSRLLRHLLMSALLLIALPATWPAATTTAQAYLAATPVAPSSAAASAAVAPAIEFVDSFGGIIPTFTISGTIAFLIQGNALTILDISAPAAPARIGHMPLAWGANALTVADGIVYVAGHGIVQIIDARNPSLPVEISRFRAHGDVDHIQVAGSLAYLTEGVAGLGVVDVSDLSRPMYLAQYAQSGCSVCFLVVGSLAYAVAYPNVLTILDISNPSVPITLSTFTLLDPAQTTFERVVVEGNRAYIGASTNISSGAQPRLVTLDITHPETPLLLGNVDLLSSLVAVSGNIAYATSHTQLNLFDVSDPTHPVARGAYSGTLTREIGEIVQVAGDRVYLADNLAAFKILDVSNPDNLIVLGSYATPPRLKYPDSIQIAGGMGYLLSRGLQVIDLTTPISPTLRGNYPSEFAFSVHVVGSHAYVDKSLSALDLLDISNPDLPTLITTLNVGTMQAVEQANNRAYILTAEQATCGKFCVFAHNMLNIFDVSNISAPVLEGRIQLFDGKYIEPSSVIVKGGFAYIASGGALRVVDVSTPATPVVRATFPIAASGNRMQMVGDLAYITSSAGLTILDLTDPLKPILLGQTGSLGDVVYSIQVQGSLAFVGSLSGVRVIDISDPTRPIPRAAYDDVRGSVQVAGDIIYVAGGTAGLHVLRLHPESFPPPMFVPLARR